jgi:hypothetical protein
MTLDEKAEKYADEVTLEPGTYRGDVVTAYVCGATESGQVDTLVTGTMFDKSRIVHNLASTEFFTISRIAELLGLRVTEVRKILKSPHPVIAGCKIDECPTPLLCERTKCQSGELYQ